jgi:hypothetical protein
MEAVLRIPPGSSLSACGHALLAFWTWLGRTLEALSVFATYWDSRVIFGLVSKEAVNERLAASAPGTFIVRVSESCAGQLALALAQAGGKVQHSLITPTGTQGAVSVLMGSGPATFSSLGAFIEQCHVLVALWPAVDKGVALRSGAPGVWPFS